MLFLSETVHPSLFMILVFIAVSMYATVRQAIGYSKYFFDLRASTG